MDQILLGNFGRRHHEEQSCEIILNLDQWFRRKCRLKVFFIWSSGSPFVQQRGTIDAILVEGIIRNNSVKLFWPWLSIHFGQKNEYVHFVKKVTKK